MKLNRLETHDRLLSFKKQQKINIFKGADDCLKKNKLSLALQEKSPYVYLFAHPRTHDNGVDKVMYWQPRLTKPEAQTNSYLFRAQSKTDLITVCWLIPPIELWPEYRMGNVTENELVLWSIDQYMHHKKKFESPDPEDLSDQQVRNIYLLVSKENGKGKTLAEKFLEKYIK